MNVEKERKYAKKLRGSFVAGLIVLPIVAFFFPSTIPWDIFDAWNVRGTLDEWFTASWPVVAWGVLITTIASLFTRSTIPLHIETEQILTQGMKISVVAGVVEEILFRWFFFTTAIAMVQVSNYLFFGFAGFGITEFFHMNIVGPIADFTTLGYLHSYIFHSSGWAVGAAMIATNNFFRDGHKYLGIFGFINSWFVGLYLFGIMFAFGLPIAIAVHFIYDFLIFVVVYFDAEVERSR